MPFVKGQSGNPGGRSTEKLWRDAIRKAAAKTAEDGKTKRIDMLAEKLIQEAMKGDVSALREFGDRIEGKATQQVDVDIKDNRSPDELSDAELAALATEGRAGITAKKADSTLLN